MLLERDQELDFLNGLLADLGSSGGKVVLIRGEAGIGKSSLVREFVDSHPDDLNTYWGACDDLFIVQPLGPFWDMARAEPSLIGPVEDGDRARLAGVVMDLLSTHLRPSVVVIEDTHWADEATLDAIKYLGRRIARTNGLLILTYRTGEIDYEHPLRGVIGDLPAQNVERIELHGLSLSAVSSIVDETSLNPQEVLAATDGNPLFVTEMASADEEAVPSSLQDSVMARTQKLSPGAQGMLKTLSVIPEPIPRSDAVGLSGASESWLDECQRRGLLDGGAEMVRFRHELTRRAVESAMTTGERAASFRTVLEDLPEKTHPCLLIHCAAEVNDVDRLIDLAPRSARYAAAAGSHRQAVDDFRELAPYLDRFEPEALGPLLAEWAREEFYVDNIPEAINLNEAALSYYREAGDRRAESKTLAQAAHFHENAGQREQAEELARQSVEVLGANPDGADLARALEVNAYLHTMAGNVAVVPELVERTLEAGGPDIDQRILIRTLNHRGIVTNISNYPEGRKSLDEAWKRAEAAGQWYEESRALFNHAWAAVEYRDLPIASDYIQRGIASAARHELPALEAYAEAMYARVLELKGDWTHAENLASDLLNSMALSRMVVLPVLGIIEARRGQDSAESRLTEAWEMSVLANENQRLVPAALALAEQAWLSGNVDLPLSEIRKVMIADLDKGFSYSPGAIAFWLWKLGELSEVPEGIAEPYRLVIEGHAEEAARIWESKGLPYDRAIALAHGDEKAQLEALDSFETLGATAVAAKLRKTMRDQGMSVPRGKGRKTRDHVGGLTARQAEVLQLLDEGLTNTEIADRLFVSPRTVEHHVSAVLTKLDSTTREEAVSRARAEGLLTAKTA